MTSPERVEIFLELLKSRSFAEAAKRRNLAPSVVSRTISQLEAELGTKLFYRTTRSVSPTQHALQYSAQMEPLLEEWKRIQSELRADAQTARGILRITSTVSFGLNHLTGLLPQFLAQNPEIQVQYLMTDAVVPLVEERIDVAIRFGTPQDSSFLSKRLFPLQYVLCGSPAYLNTVNRLREPQELANTQCLAFLSSDHSQLWRFRNRANPKWTESVVPRGRIQVSSALALKQLALSAAGIALLPLNLIREDLKIGRLVEVLPSFEATLSDFDSWAWLLTPGRSFAPLKIRRFVDFLTHHFGGSALPATQPQARRPLSRSKRGPHK